MKLLFSFLYLYGLWCRLNTCLWLNSCLKKDLQVIRTSWRAKGVIFGQLKSVTSHHQVHELWQSALEHCHESAPASRVMTERSCHELALASRVATARSCNFSILSSFLVLGITLPIEVQIKWIKLLWKVNTEYFSWRKYSGIKLFEWMKMPLNLLLLFGIVTFGD